MRQGQNSEVTLNSDLTSFDDGNDTDQVTSCPVVSFFCVHLVNRMDNILPFFSDLHSQLLVFYCFCYGHPPMLREGRTEARPPIDTTEDSKMA